jgi:hypothetical protein
MMLAVMIRQCVEKWSRCLELQMGLEVFSRQTQ